MIRGKRHFRISSHDVTFPVINFQKRETGDIKRSCFLLVDGVLVPEGPGTEIRMFLGRVVGVFVSLPKTNSVLNFVISSELLVSHKHKRQHGEHESLSLAKQHALSQTVLTLYIYIFQTQLSVTNLTILLLLSDFKFSFEESEGPH